MNLVHDVLGEAQNLKWIFGDECYLDFKKKIVQSCLENFILSGQNEA